MFTNKKKLAELTERYEELKIAHQHLYEKIIALDKRIADLDEKTAHHYRIIRDIKNRLNKKESSNGQE